MRRPVLLITLALLAFAPSAAASGSPDLIRLPDGFAPEGIAAGSGRTLFVGSLVDGAVYAADARTGAGAVRVAGRAGRSAAGLEADRRGNLFVAGGATGTAFVYDSRSGADLAQYAFAGAGFVNDVAVTRDGAWFTDSNVPRLYVVRKDRRGRPAGTRIVELSGDIAYQPAPAFNLNGIVAARGGRLLIAVQSATGKLFTITRAGRTREIDLGGQTLLNGDGLLLRGRTLYVVRNRDNLIAVVRLDPRLRSGRVIGSLTDPDFDVPTTIAAQGGRLYAVNARFGTPPAGARYDIVKVG